MWLPMLGETNSLKTSWGVTNLGFWKINKRNPKICRSCFFQTNEYQFSLFGKQWISNLVVTAVEWIYLEYTIVFVAAYNEEINTPIWNAPLGLGHCS